MASNTKPDPSASSTSNFSHENVALIRDLEEKPDTVQTELAKKEIASLLSACQGRDSSGKECIRLCHFIELCKKSQASCLRDLAYSKQTCSELFDFYILWTEHTQPRALRQVLELLVHLLLTHPDKSTSDVVKADILQRILSVLCHQAAQSNVKAAFKALEFFLAKNALSVSEVIRADTQYAKDAEPWLALGNAGDGFGSELSSWDHLMSTLFNWMSLPPVSPIAGKVTAIFMQALRKDSPFSIHAITFWDAWIARYTNGPTHESLENVKNYVLPHLFKLDRSGSVEFLGRLTEKATGPLSEDVLLLLATLEVGKKGGLVEEPDIITPEKPSKKVRETMAFPEMTIGPFLGHNSELVRSMAFAVLVSSPSPLRPYSEGTMSMFKKHLGILHADTDAKTRNEVLSNVRHMLDRVRGATSFLSREDLSLEAERRKNLDLSATQPSKRDIEITKSQTTIRQLLQCHQDFVSWYMQFLIEELVPTASYQRHSTALRVILIALKSGLLICSADTQAHIVTDNKSPWPFKIEFFNAATVRIFLDLVLDPFEDVRNLAAEVLKWAPAHSLARDLQDDASGLSESGNAVPSHGLEHLLRNVAQPNQSQAEHPFLASMGLLTKFISRAEAMAQRTGRADFADGVARSYDLLHQLLPNVQSRMALLSTLLKELERRIDIAQDDLSNAVSVAPVHDLLAALELIWNHADWQDQQGPGSTTAADVYQNLLDLQQHTINYCERIWVIVKDVLCNDSPEGLVLEDIEDVNTIDTKDVLSYSFRAVHASSNLMRSMVEKLPRGKGDQFLPFPCFRNIGNLTFEQLSSLRHRGAFSTVSLTFAKCCQMTRYLDNTGASSEDLLQKWYQGTLACIFDQMSTTRRSAGIPALMVGILTANSPAPSFEEIMVQLKALAQRPVQLSRIDETNLPQVHAMNCLKEIFKSSSLDRKAEPYISEGLRLAADSLRSDIWAIRNCGLLLLRSLIDCLFGTNESKVITEAGWDGKSIRLSYAKYPDLPDLLIDLLNTENQSPSSEGPEALAAVESVFPALDIIRRAGPPDRQLDKIFKCVAKHIGSRFWHVRDIAARTLCTLSLHDEWKSTMKGLIETYGSSPNSLHGTLMAVRYTVDRRKEMGLRDTDNDCLEFTQYLEQLRKARHQMFSNPDIEAAYVEVLNAITRPSASTYFSPSVSLNLDSVYNRLKQEPPTDHSEATDTRQPNGSALLREALTTQAVYIVANSARGIDPLVNILKLVVANDPDTARSMLRCMHSIDFDSSTNKLGPGQVVKILDSNAEFYIKILPSAQDPSICSLLLSHLQENLEHRARLYKSFPTAPPPSQPDYSKCTIAAIRRSLTGSKQSPELTNSEIQVLGILLALEPEADPIHTWGLMLSEVGRAENDFDSRSAAAESLKLFYSTYNLENASQKEFLLPSLLALYDVLDDDDDEIRDQGAAIVSQMHKQNLNPLAAAELFASWLYTTFPTSPLLSSSIARRLTANDNTLPSNTRNVKLLSVASQLGEALKNDDALFAVEEQNLFIDEVRETTRWCQVLRTVEGPAWNETFNLLVEWAIEGIKEIARVAENEDGPMGWVSKPQVFAICMSAVLVSKTLLERADQAAADAASGVLSDPKTLFKIAVLREKIERLVEVGRKGRLHASLMTKLTGEKYFVVVPSRK